MTGGGGTGTRKYVPREAYELLALMALAYRRGSPASKGELARELRANHYMITRTLASLVEAGRVNVEERADGAHEITLTEAGQAFLEEHGDSLMLAFEDRIARHYAFGRAPPWVQARELA